MNCVASYVPWVQRNRLWANRLAHTLPNSAYAVGDVRVSEAEQATLAAMAEALGGGAIGFAPTPYLQVPKACFRGCATDSVCQGA